MNFDGGLLAIGICVSLALAALPTPAAAQPSRYNDVQFRTVLEDPDDHVGFFDIRSVAIGELLHETVVFRVQTDRFERTPPASRLVLNFTTTSGNFSTGVNSDGAIFAGKWTQGRFERCFTAQGEGLVYCEMSYTELGTHPETAEGYRIVNVSALTNASDAPQDYAPGPSWIGPHHDAVGPGEIFRDHWSNVTSILRGTVPWNVTDQDPTDRNLTEKDPTGKNLTIERLLDTIPTGTLRNLTWNTSRDGSETVAENASAGPIVGNDYRLQDPLAPPDIRLTARRPLVTTRVGGSFEIPLALENVGESRTAVRWSIDAPRFTNLRFSPDYRAIDSWQRGPHRLEPILHGQVPESAKVGRYNVTVRAIGQSTRGAAVATVQIGEPSQPSVALALDEDAWFAPPMKTVSGPVQVRNDGNASTRFWLSVDGIDDLETAWVEPSAGVLDPGETVEGQVSLSAPARPANGTYRFDLRLETEAGEQIVHRLLLQVREPKPETSPARSLPSGDLPAIPGPSAVLSVMSLLAAGVVHAGRARHRN